MRLLLTLSSIFLCVAPLSMHAQIQQPLFTVDSLTVRRQDFPTGSVDVVTEARMNKGLVTNSLNALSGQAAGVNISSGENRMAQLSAVRVRGTTSLTGGNDPLVIIDGVYSDLSTLSSIYPADIESFSILKNAAETAQYGSRGASGVIQVTTKKGSGAQFHLSYDGNVGIESKYRTVDMLDGPAYIATAKSLGLGYTDGGFDTNFQDVVTRTGFVMNHHVAFSGGTEKSSYRASLGTMDHTTVVRVNEYKNFAAKFDLSQKAFDDLLSIDFGVFGSSQKNKYPFDEQKLFYSAATQNPTYPAGRDASGNWNKNVTASQINPPAALLLEKNDEKNLNFNTHLGLDFDLLGIVSGHRPSPQGVTSEQLHLKIFGAYSYTSLENGIFCPTWVWAQGQAYRGEHKTEGWLGNATLSYENTWGNHHLSATLLGEYQKSNRSGFWTLVKGFTSNAFGYDNLGAASTIPYGGTGSETADPALASYMGGLAYTFLGRYTVNANLRADGSSMFGDNNKWGYFPSISGTWNIADEPFFRPWRQAISIFKLRVGYGLSGNLGGIDSYNSLSLVRPQGTVSVGGTPTTTMGIYRNANPDLKWETRSTFNVGADLCFWHNRVVLTAEYYYSKTTDMLYQYDVPVPPFTFGKLLANLGSMSNQGFEMGVGITAIEQRDMELNINVNLSWQKNKLLSLSGDYNGTHLSAADITQIGSLNGAGFHGGDNNIVYQIVGQPLGVFYLPHCTGLQQNADGSYSYAIADLDDNQRVNIEDGGDRYVAGQATPKWTLGSNISLRYKAFDISLQMNGAFGHKIYNGTALTYMNLSSFPDYNVMAKAPAQNIKDQTATDYWLERGDYLNFDYLTVGWNVPVRWRYASSLRLSLSVNNLATITSYSGITPMINSYIVNNTLGIDDKRSYPAYRSYCVGVSVQF
ncbi:MAG: SusC/RagA family TonB-linked outer membrane protein [Prevotella sp.]|nr:SusC/RagA family TonB-linked outer membrane protein [Prevotella sp.]